MCVETHIPLRSRFRTFRAGPVYWCGHVGKATQSIYFDSSLGKHWGLFAARQSSYRSVQCLTAAESLRPSCARMTLGANADSEYADAWVRAGPLHVLDKIGNSVVVHVIYVKRIPDTCSSGIFASTDD
jgi:hypothetical protein